MLFSMPALRTQLTEILGPPTLKPDLTARLNYVLQVFEVTYMCVRPILGALIRAVLNRTSRPR